MMKMMMMMEDLIIKTIQTNMIYIIVDAIHWRNTRGRRRGGGRRRRRFASKSIPINNLGLVHLFTMMKLLFFFFFFICFIPRIDSGLVSMNPKFPLPVRFQKKNPPLSLSPHPTKWLYFFITNFLFFMWNFCHFFFDSSHLSHWDRLNSIEHWDQNYGRNRNVSFKIQLIGHIECESFWQNLSSQIKN